MKSFISLFSSCLIIAITFGVALGEDYEQDTLYDDEEQNRDARLSGDLFSFLGDDDYGGRSYRFRRQEDDQENVYDYENQRDSRFIGNLLPYGSRNRRGYYRDTRQQRQQAQGTLKAPNQILGVGQKCSRDGRNGFCKNSVCCCQPGKSDGVCMAVSDLGTDKWCWKSY